MTVEYKKIEQRQDTRANLNAIIRNNFLAYDLDSSRLLYSSDGASWTEFVNAADLAGLSSVYLPSTGIDASKIISGTIDLARIPVLPSQIQVVSSGDLTALTTSQQTQIGQGTVVTTSDGSRYVYSGAGSKTLAASYVLLADITPEWAVIANKPSTLSGYGVSASDTLFDSKYLGISANAVSASKLATARTINGVSFDGSANISFTTSAVSEGTNLYYTDARARASISVSGLPLSYSSSTGVLSIAQATSSVAGYLSASDWTTFNGKLNLSSVLTGYAVGSSAALAATDTLLSAFGKVQAQINTLSSTFSSYSTKAVADTLYLGISANAVSATKLATARTIAGVSFDGSANISIPFSGLSSIPTTVSGYGITDILSQALTGYAVGSNAALATTDTILGAFAKIQAQINAKQASGSYLTANQTITCSGDATGSGTTAISLTLAASGVTAGTYKSVTVDAKGRVTAGTNPTTLSGYGITDALLATTAASTYLPLAGGTMTGGINMYSASSGITFPNGVWNTVGDDSSFGDINEGNTLGLKGSDGTEAAYIRFGATIGSTAKGCKVGYTGSSFQIPTTLTTNCVVISGNTPLILTGAGSGTYNQTAVYSNSTGLVIERPLASDSSSASPLAFNISRRGGTVDFSVGSSNVVSSLPFYANELHSNTSYAGTGLFAGTGDGATTSTYNQKLTSWYGTGIWDACYSKCTGYIDHRLGKLYLAGDIISGSWVYGATLKATSAIYSNRSAIDIWNASTSGTDATWGHQSASLFGISHAVDGSYLNLNSTTKIVDLINGSWVCQTTASGFQTNVAVISPKFTFSSSTVIGSSTVLPTLAVGECILIYGQGVGSVTNCPITNSTQRVGYRTSAGATATAAISTSLSLDLYGKCGLLVCLSATYCQLIM